MARSGTQRPAWKDIVGTKAPILLPAAHDALTAKLIERAGFDAYQVGGFAIEGLLPCHSDLTHFGEMSAAVREIIMASSLPVLVDADDGYGDVKNVTRTVREYEALGASAIFIEDQRAPKRCGHMRGKEVVPAEVMEGKVRAAAAARQNHEFFLIARTDARGPHGLDEALRRAERYLDCGADGLFVEGPENVEELRRIGSAFRGVPQIANMLEGGGRTPLLRPSELHELGFSMVTYPTSLIFRVARTLEKALDDMKSERLELDGQGVDFQRFEEIVGLPGWAEIESRFGMR